MTSLEQRIRNLEIQLTGQVAAIQSLQAQTAALAQNSRTTQQSPFGGGSGTGGSIYSIAPVVITGGGNVTGQTVYALVSGTSTALGGTWTVYNQMAAATVATAGKTILVVPNGDGTFTAVAQSC